MLKTIIGHNLRFDHAVLTRTLERLAVSAEDATLALDAWNKVYASSAGLKARVAALLDWTPVKGEIVWAERTEDGGRSRMRLARVLATSAGSSLESTTQVEFLDTHGTVWRRPESELAPIDVITALSILGDDRVLAD